MRAEAPTRHRAFLASTWADARIRRLRGAVWFTGRRGITNPDAPSPIWVAENDAPDLGEHKGKDDLEIIDACLDAIEASNRFVLLDNGEYGTRLELPIGSSASWFLELELFQAATLRKPITLITVGETAMTSSPLARFMHQVAQGEPDIRPARDLVHAETLILEAIFDSGSATSIDALGRNRAVQALAIERHKDWKNERLFEEPILLNGMPAGDVDGERDAEVAAWYLDRADEQTGMNYVLSRTWFGPVTLLCRPKCSFRPPFVRRRRDFSSPVLSGGDVDCRSR